MIKPADPIRKVFVKQSSFTLTNVSSSCIFSHLSVINTYISKLQGQCRQCFHSHFVELPKSLRSIQERSYDSSHSTQLYDITTLFAICYSRNIKLRTYEWRKYERKCATYLPMSYTTVIAGHFYRPAWYADAV